MPFQLFKKKSPKATVTPPSAPTVDLFHTPPTTPNPIIHPLAKRLVKLAPRSGQGDFPRRKANSQSLPYDPRILEPEPNHEPWVGMTLEQALEADSSTVPGSLLPVDKSRIAPWTVEPVRGSQEQKGNATTKLNIQNLWPFVHQPSLVRVQPATPTRLHSLAPTRPPPPPPPPTPAPVYLLIGKQSLTSAYLTPRLFRINAGTLSRSKILTAHIQNPQNVLATRPTTGDGNNTYIHLPDLDPEAFELYLDYLDQNAISSKWRDGTQNEHSDYSWMQYWALVNAHILATTLGDAEFSEYVLDLLETRLTAGQCADVKTIKHVFASKGASDSLKRFLVNLNIDAGAQHFRDQDTSQYPSPYILMALEIALDRISNSEEATDTSACAYPVHREDNDLSKSKPGKEKSQREIKLDRIKEATTEDIRQAADIAHRNGVKGIDWAARQTAQPVKVANRTSWVGFRRLDQMWPSRKSSQAHTSFENGIAATTELAGPEQHSSENDADTDWTALLYGLDAMAEDAEAVDEEAISQGVFASFSMTHSTSADDDSAKCDEREVVDEIKNHAESSKLADYDGNGLDVRFRCPGAYPESIPETDTV
ncbi:hypothetical protein BDV95DRAFT_599618 [Massariosphaeria phaeospora]|uniref:BTB domain-containing protein n=1 Tax=Massariosphaeria phaeospora TaxID=100035 RepID=A0A7C8HYZ5_9PLEO|nr:hypothetical protein BDV95DRAFT_599618 [Massariosphaeria phaeospora]